MSARSNTKSAVTKAGILTVDGIPYTLARSDVFYYIKVIDYDKELFKSASNLKAKPTVIFYTENSQDKVIIDYSLANTTDKKYLSSFFANMNQLSTFSLTTGQYLDASELEADISCSLIFDEYKDGKIFARLSSVTSKNSALDEYFGDYFIGTPQLLKSGGLGNSNATKNYAIISINPNTNTPLKNLGAIVGDVAEVVNSSSSNNQIKFKITEITSINDKEVFKVTPINLDHLPVLESLVGSASIINLYIKGTSSLTPELNGNLGCCYVEKVGLENSTNYQCSIRQGKYIAGICDSNLTNLITTTNPVITENLIATGINSILSTSVFENIISFKNSSAGPVPISTLSIYFGDFDSIQNNKILVKRNNNYTFKQSDISNLNYAIKFSTNQTTFTPYVSGIYGSMKRNGVDSITVLPILTDTPTLYMFLEQTIESQAGNTSKFYYSGYSLVIVD